MQVTCCVPGWHNPRPSGTADSVVPVPQVAAQSSCEQD